MLLECDNFCIEYEIIYSPEAEMQLYEILLNLAIHAGAFSADRLLQRIYSNIEHLKRNPFIGRERSNNLGTREIFPENYRVVYEVIDHLAEIHILAIVHSRMLYPRPEQIGKTEVI